MNTLDTVYRKVIWCNLDLALGLRSVGLGHWRWRGRICLVRRRRGELVRLRKLGGGGYEMRIRFEIGEDELERR
jgi:hypothetical protein